MNAIRRDEDLDELHSLYVDQRDREAIIAKSDRSLETLKAKVLRIYDALKATEDALGKKFSSLKPILPETIHFISTQELEDMYPTNSPKEREDLICKEYGSVFLMQIGDLMKS